MTVVLDASALVHGLLGTSVEHRLLRRRLVAEVCHAPHLIDAEVGNVLRRRVLRGELSASTARDLLAAAGPLVDHRHEMAGALAAPPGGFAGSSRSTTRCTRGWPRVWRCRSSPATSGCHEPPGSPAPWSSSARVESPHLRTRLSGRAPRTLALDR